MGRHVGKGIFRMGTSVILSEYQGKGIYSKLLSHVTSWCRDQGFWAIESNHNACNSRIIAMKLNKGFYITGQETTLTVGSLVRLVKFLDSEHEDLFKFRNGFMKPSQSTKELLGIE